MRVVNTNALYKELLRRGNDSNYTKIRKSVNGDSPKGTLSEEEKKTLIGIIEEHVRVAKKNILNS